MEPPCIYTVISYNTRVPCILQASTHKPYCFWLCQIVNNIIKFVRRCKSTLYFTLRTVSHLVPVIHGKLPQATVPVTSSPHTDTERSSLYTREGNWKLREKKIQKGSLLVVRMTKIRSHRGRVIGSAKVNFQ